MEGVALGEESGTSMTAVLEQPAAATGEPAGEHVELAEDFGGLGEPMSKERWEAYAEVQARMSVLIPLPRISLNQLLSLKAGTMLISEWQISQDVPLLVGDVFLANVSCEPAGERLGVRINGFDQPLKGL